MGQSCRVLGVVCVLGQGFPARTGVGERSSSSIPGWWWGPPVAVRWTEASGPLVLVLVPCGTLIGSREAGRVLSMQNPVQPPWTRKGQPHERKDRPERRDLGCSGLVVASHAMNVEVLL